MDKLVRLQKFMAECGVGSRRKCEEYILSGEVKVNGKKAGLGLKINPLKDKVTFLNKGISASKKSYYIVYKPKDYITTKSDPEMRKTIYDLLPTELHFLHPVGRLDRNSTGILLLTNDGELTNQLLHPSKKVLKKYRVSLNKPLLKKDFDKFQEGVFLDGKLTLPASCFLLENDLYEVHIKEGRNRQIRRMFEILGYEVLTLKRFEFGPLRLGKMKIGQYRELTSFELRKLLND